jgi:hypothetical protein
MSAQRDFQFMASKMKALDTAIFSNYSPAVVKFPSCLVSALEFDAQGDVLFSIPRAFEDMTGFDLTFPGHLHFFNSDFDYYVEADGRATITITEGEVGVAFRVVKAQYCYSATRNSKGLSRLFHIFMEFIFAHKRSEIWYDNYGFTNNNN